MTVICVCQCLYFWYTPVHWLAICCFHSLHYKGITLKVRGHILLCCSKYFLYLKFSTELKCWIYHAVEKQTSNTDDMGEKGGPENIGVWTNPMCMGRPKQTQNMKTSKSSKELRRMLSGVAGIRSLKPPVSFQLSNLYCNHRICLHIPLCIL